MKFINPLPILIASFAFTPIGGGEEIIPVKLTPYIYTEKIYGGFDGSKDEDIDLYFVFIKKNTYLKVEYYNSSSNLIGGSRIEVPYENTQVSHLTYNLKLKNRLKNDGLFIKFLLQNEDGSSVYYSSLLELYPIVKSEIYSYQYQYQPLVISKRHFKFNHDKTIHYPEEIIFFHNTIRNLDINEDYSLELSTINFEYNFDKDDLNFGKGYLCAKDNENDFPYLTKNNDNIFKISLDSFYDNGTLSFEIHDTLFYNRLTLEMSNEYRIGFEATNKLYIPPKRANILNKNSFEICIEDFGENKLTVHIPLLLEVNNHFVGGCSDSDFCIEGGIL